MLFHCFWLFYLDLVMQLFQVRATLSQDFPSWMTEDQWPSYSDKDVAGTMVAPS